jgi:hypothetical protein
VYRGLTCVACVVILIACSRPLHNDAVTRIIGHQGGTIRVSDKKSPIAGVSVHVPRGAVETSCAFSILETSVQLPRPSGFPDLASPPFEIVVAGNCLLLEAAVLSIPIAALPGHTTDYCLVKVGSGGETSLLFPTELDEEAQLASFELCRFSRFQLFSGAAVVPEDLPSYSISGFDAVDDAFRVSNDWPNQYDDGCCYGMTLFAAWYWIHHSGETRLRDQYDEAAARQIAESAQAALPATWRPIYWDDAARDLAEIISKMTAEGVPQPVGLAEGKRGTGKLHVVLAYAWIAEDNTLLCLDPNSVGVTRTPPEAHIARITLDSSGEWYCTGADWTLYRGVSKIGGLEQHEAKMQRVYEDFQIERLIGTWRGEAELVMTIEMDHAIDADGNKIYDFYSQSEPVVETVALEIVRRGKNSLAGTWYQVGMHGTMYDEPAPMTLDDVNYTDGVLTMRGYEYYVHGNLTHELHADFECVLFGSTITGSGVMIQDGKGGSDPNETEVTLRYTDIELVRE